ncbi:MAG: hypothetical protein LDL12_07235 [Anaerolinea sp.]|nr:hypothetical protein [Anaerolinea sp.]
MDIYLAAEQAFFLVPQISLEVARDRVEQKKASLMMGTIGAIFSQPKADEIRLLSFESRFEPYWVVRASSSTLYDRERIYTVPTGGPEVKSVTVLGQEVQALPQVRGAAVLQLNVIEHCVQQLTSVQMVDGMTGGRGDFQKYQAVAKTEIADLNTFAPPGMLVLAPQVRASAVVRQVTAEVVQPVQNAQVIHEERVDVELIELNFRPVYAFEYEWPSKNRRVVIEMDAVTTEVRSGGKRWGDQLKGVLTRDLLFDITADAVGMILPGGSIAVKLVKAVVDRGK